MMHVIRGNKGILQVDCLLRMKKRRQKLAIYRRSHVTACHCHTSLMTDPCLLGAGADRHEPNILVTSQSHTRISIRGGSASSGSSSSSAMRKV